jgi:uncharacterized protein YjbI with pentapeptide repeats
MDHRQTLFELLADRVSLEYKGGNPLEIKIHFHDKDFSGIDLRGQNLMDSEFNNCNFTGSHLDGCRLSGSVWDCVFEGTTFNKAIFSDIHFIECNFNDANFSNVLFNQCHLSPPSSFVNAKFPGANLDGLNIDPSKVPELNLKDATIGGIVLDKTSQLENANEYLRLRREFGKDFLKEEANKKLIKAEEAQEPFKERVHRQYLFTFYSRELINVCKYAFTGYNLEATNRRLHNSALKMIDKDLSLSAVDEHGHSAYYYAVDNGWTDVVRQMIVKGGVDRNNRPSKRRQQFDFKEEIKQPVIMGHMRLYIACFTHGSIETYNNDDATFGYHRFQMPEDITLKYLSFTTPGNICCMNEEKAERIMEDVILLKDQTESKTLESIEGDIHTFAKKVESDISCLFEKSPNKYITRYHKHASQEGYSRVVTVKPGEVMVNKNFTLDKKLTTKFDLRINIVGHESIDIADIFGETSVTLENLIIFLKMHLVTEVFFADFSCSGFLRVEDESVNNKMISSLKSSKVKYGGVTKRRFKKKSIKKMRIKKSRKNKKRSKK